MDLPSSGVVPAPAITPGNSPWVRWMFRAAIGAAAAAAVLVIAVLGAGWYFAGELEQQALSIDHSPDPPDLVASPVRDGVVRLSEGPGGGSWTKPGTFGLEWNGGYAQVSEIRATGDGWVERDVRVLLGELAANTPARIDSFALPGDPMSAFGYPFEEVAVTGPLGAMPAWLVPGTRADAWVIFVHGQNSNRREFLRSLPAVHDAGLTALVITYRNDEGAPLNPDHRLHYGATEWRDVDAAVVYALDHGARRIVLEGFSMGGSVALSFLLNSPRADAVTGVVLDSPMLDFRETVGFRAPDSVPALILNAGAWIAGIRYDIDWDELDYAARAAELRTPILLFQGSGDTSVPPAIADRFAASRPDLVALVRTTAGHVRSWNADPAAYDAAHVAFLAKALP